MGIPRRRLGFGRTRAAADSVAAVAGGVCPRILLLAAATLPELGARLRNRFCLGSWECGFGAMYSSVTRCSLLSRLCFAGYL